MLKVNVGGQSTDFFFICSETNVHLLVVSRAELKMAKTSKVNLTKVEKLLKYLIIFSSEYKIPSSSI